MSQPNPRVVPFAGRIALVNYGLKQLREQQLAGLFVIERLLRSQKNDADEQTELQCFMHDLAKLLATVNLAVEEKINFLITLAEANQQELTQ